MKLTDVVSPSAIGYGGYRAGASLAASGDVETGQLVGWAGGLYLLSAVLFVRGGLPCAKR